MENATWHYYNAGTTQPPTSVSEIDVSAHGNVIKHERADITPHNIISIEMDSVLAIKSINKH